MPPAETTSEDVLEAWLDRVSAALGVERSVLTRTAAPVLDAVRDVAHGVQRPAGPLTAFLVGVAAGRAGGTPEDLACQVLASLEVVGDEVDTWERGVGS